MSEWIDLYLMRRFLTGGEGALYFFLTPSPDDDWEMFDLKRNGNKALPTDRQTNEREIL